MEPAGSVDHKEDRNRPEGMAGVGTGHRISHTKGQPAGIPESDHEPFEANTGHYLEWSTASDRETTYFATTTIHRNLNRINHAASTQVGALSTDRSLRHTHLQRVASGSPVHRTGGGRC